MTLESGLEVPTERLAEICRRYGIQEMAIFGSAARSSPVSSRAGILPLEPELAAASGRRIDLGTKRFIRPRIWHDQPRLVVAAGSVSNPFHIAQIRRARLRAIEAF